MDVAALLAKTSDNLSVRRAFGTAYEKDGVLIIPVAMVAGGGGGGTGTRPRRHDATGSGGPPGDGAAEPGGTGQHGTGQDGTAQDGTGQDGERTEAGGGFGGVVLPTGAYVVKDGQVRWVPAVDTTMVVLASLGLARLLIRTWTRSRRP
jgi:uncharacterized spore protein YtfJ